MAYQQSARGDAPSGKQMIVRVISKRLKTIMLCESMSDAARLTRGMHGVRIQTVREEDLSPDETGWLETQRQIARIMKGSTGI